MNIRTLAAELIAKIAGTPNAEVPTTRLSWVTPSWEPPNLSQNATVQTVQTAIRAAESGETRQLFSLYRDSLLGDEHVQGELSKRKLAVLAQPLAVQPREADNEEDMAAAAAVKRAIDDCENWSDGLGALLDSTLWPVAIVERIFKAAENNGAGMEAGPPLQYTLKRFEPVNPALFCFRHAFLVGRSGQLTPLPTRPNAELQAGAMTSPSGSPVTGAPLQLDPNSWEPFIRLWPVDEYGRIYTDLQRAMPLDHERHIVHRGHLLTAQRDHWGGPMRAIMAWWLLRGLGRDWFARFMERYGAPFPVAKTNLSDQTAVQALQAAFSLATKVGGLVIGEDDQLDLKEALVQGGAEGHEKWHRVCNDAISFAITGVKSTERPAGLNAGESQRSENVREDVRMFDQLRLAETLEKQFAAPFLRINGLPGAVRFVWGGLSEEDAKALADTLQVLAQAGLEPTDEALPIVSQRIGLAVQRKQLAMPGALPSAATMPGGVRFGALPSAATAADTLLVSLGPPALAPNGLAIEQDRAARRAGALPSAATSHPSDRIVAARSKVLSEAYRGAMAPIRQIIASSTSREDCLQKLQAFYPDWKPERLAAEMEIALQLCAAAGAAAAEAP